MSKRAKRNIPSVALLIETTRAYGRNILRGIGDYARIYGPWIFHLPVETPIKTVPDQDEWDGEGIIAQPHQDQAMLAQLASCGKPVVSLSGPPGTGGLPAVRANQEAVAELSMQHFRDRGFTRFAYCVAPPERHWPPTAALFKKLEETSG
jgi:LacI family transcriptional regulator